MSDSEIDRPTKTMPCKVCNRPIVVSLYRSKQVRCSDCAISAFEDATRQIAARSGPYYEKWRANGGNGRYGRGRGRGQNNP